MSAPSEVTIGDEARVFMDTYALREDAVRYATANGATDWEEGGWRVIIGHDPDGRRLRMTCRRDSLHVVHVRPIE
jgi:hypothetical protein